MIPVPPIFGDNFKIYSATFTTTADTGPVLPGAFNAPATYQEIATTIPGDPSNHFNVPLDGAYNQSIDVDIYFYTNSAVGFSIYDVAFGMRFYDAGGVPFTPPTTSTPLDPLLTNDGIMLRFSYSLPQGHPYVEGRLIWATRTAGVGLVKWGWDATAQTTMGTTGSQPLNWRIISWK